MTASGGSSHSTDTTLDVLSEKIFPDLCEKISKNDVESQPRGTISREVKTFALECLETQGMELNLLDQRDLVSKLTNKLIEKYN